MKKNIILAASVFFIVAAAFLTFAAPQRYGAHGDNLPCGKNSERRSFYTATSYFALTESIDRNTITVGTCPYQYYSAKTYSLELWATGIILGYIAYRKR